MGRNCLSGLPPNIKFVSAHLYTWVEKAIVSVKCLPHEHNCYAMSLTRAGPKLFDLEASTLIMRPPCLTNKARRNKNMLEESCDMCQITAITD